MKTTKANLPRLTNRSIQLLVLMCLALGYGLWHHDITIIHLSLFCGIVLVISYGLSYYNFNALSLERILPERLFSREEFKVKLKIYNQKRNFNSYCIDIEDELLGNGRFATTVNQNGISPIEKAPLLIAETPASYTSETSALSFFRRRGAYSSFNCHLSSKFPFGLFLREAEIELSSQILVYPSPASPPQLKQLFANGQGTGNDSSNIRRDSVGEFKGLREFSHGDPMKLIHWPLSARYQQLVVKEFEPSTPEKLVIIFHSFQPAGHPQMHSPEYTLRLLSGMFLHLHETGTEFDFIASFNDWESMKVSESPDELDDVMESLSRADIQGLSNLTPLVELLDDMPEDDRRIVILSNTSCKYWKNLLGNRNSLICLDNRMKIPIPEQKMNKVRLKNERKKFEHLKA